MQRDLTRDRLIARSLPLRVWRPSTSRPTRRRPLGKDGAAFLRQHTKIQRELEGAAELLLKTDKFREDP